MGLPLAARSIVSGGRKLVPVRLPVRLSMVAYSFDVEIASAASCVDDFAVGTEMKAWLLGEARMERRVAALYPTMVMLFVGSNDDVKNENALTTCTRRMTMLASQFRFRSLYSPPSLPEALHTYLTYV